MSRILIAGDRTIDWFYYPRPAEGSGENWRLQASVQAFCVAGGVLLLEKMVTAALAVYGRDAEISATPAPTGELRTVSPEQMVHSNARLDPFDLGKHKRWLVSKSLGFMGPSRATSSEAGAAPQPQMLDPDLIVLDDHGNGFRNERSAWPEALRSWNGRTPLIHKMRHPLDKDRRRDVLWHELQQRLRGEGGNYVLMISADDLRATEGVQISQGLSWERTAKEFLYQMRHAPALKPLQLCPCVVVTFGWDGAIVYSPPQRPGECESATLHFDPQGIEGGFGGSLPGGMFGMTSVFLATLVARVVIAEEERASLKASRTMSLRDVVDGAIPESLARARLWLETGFGTDQRPCTGYPMETVFPPAPPKPQRPAAPPPEMFSWTWIPPTTSTTDSDPANWRIVHQEWPAISAVIAKEYVRTGQSPGLMRSPMGVFGKLKTVDRAEIESYNAIRTLVQEFLLSNFRQRPLCIGVFGPPGAGKSFGVEEVIGSITIGGLRTEKLTFNVSQFASERDLAAACHRVRDKVLEGRTPFVFFDEFDSAGLDGAKLGWLRSFLALMQDGKFRDGEEMHPLGKCILVFAGGTADSFHDFEKEALAAPLKRKGRDFVSRLRGYINVMGPNPHGDDSAFVLRRAIMLRSMFDRNKDAQGLFDSQRHLQIDDGILRALLLVSHYRHGTRSMEAVLEMSRLAGQSRFDCYALPSRDQLDIHVPADEFVMLTRPGPQSAEIERMVQWLEAIGYEVRPLPADRNADWGGSGDRPQTPLITDGDEFQYLAEQSHLHWCETQRASGVEPGAEEVRGRTNPYLKPLAELPRAIRELIDNRVRQIPLILHDAGLEIVQRDEPSDWDDEALINKLAEIVHGSYRDTVDQEVAARREAGLLPPYRPNVVEFSKLSPAKQDSNRDFVRTIPRKLYRAGLTLTPRASGATSPGPETNRLITQRLEQLAQLEHTRWNWQSVLQGYVYKPGRTNEARRTNPAILPWDLLGPADRQYDFENSKRLPGLIFEAGYEVSDH